MTKAHRLKIRKGMSPQLGLAVPINFLLGCSDAELGKYELARLADVANTRAQIQILQDQATDHMALAYLAAWMRSMDRPALKHAIENEESPYEWAKRMIREGQRSEKENEESIPRPPLPPGAAHLAASLRYQERNIAEGKCSLCPKSLARNSVRFCEKHLAMSRARNQQKKALSLPGTREYLYAGVLSESTQGRQSGTLASLAMNREKKTRAVLAEMGIPPESAAVSLRAAKDALLKVMPDSKAKALAAMELFQAAIVPSEQTGRNALGELLAEGKIQRIGKGINRDPFRYFGGEN